MEAVKDGKESVYNVGAAVMGGKLWWEHVKVDHRCIGNCARVCPCFVEMSVEVHGELSIIVVSVLVRVKVEGGERLSVRVKMARV